MSQYDQMFIEEAKEQLEIAIGALSSLEEGTKDDPLDEAFRALHTFKGAAYIFNLETLGDFAHKLESILDAIRKGGVSDTLYVAGQLLIFLDHLQILMDDPEITDEGLRQTHQEISTELDILSEEISNEELMISQEASKNEDGPSADRPLITYLINIVPLIEIQDGDYHPVIDIIEDIVDSGNGKAKVLARLHGPSGDKNSKSIKSWNIIICNDTSKGDIEAMFMFIDTDVKPTIEKLQEADLFSNEGFTAILDELEENSNDDINTSIHEFIEGTKKTAPKPQKQSTHTAKTETIRISTRKIDKLMDLVSELVTDQASLAMLSEKFGDTDLESIVENMDRHILQLRDIVFDMTLVPIETLMSRIRRMVRNLSRSLGKDISFETIGSETELDKMFIDMLMDPIMHIVRNSMDHGIESQEIRKRLGKPEKGQILVETNYNGADVQIDISDDGKGLDTEVIYNKALERGIISKGAVLSQEEIYSLIFEPGFSTAKNVTDISGRGVGMDVVKKNVMQLKGEINVSSEKQKGTTITIKIPLSLSIVDGLLVRSGNEQFIIPVQVIKKCHEVNLKGLYGNFNDTMVLDNKQFPFIDLEKELLNRSEIPEGNGIAIIIMDRGREVVLIVDEILGEFQAVLKPIGAHYKHQEFISGATILGDGNVALVLDANKLIELKTKHSEHVTK